LGKVPNREGSSKIQKVPNFQLGKVQKEGGEVITFQKAPKFEKVPKFHLMRTISRKNLYFFALKMANNTLLFLKIVFDFVSKLTIFNLFKRFWRGSLCFKLFPSCNISQVPFRGGVIPFQKSHKLGREGKGSSPLENFSQVSALFNFEGSPNHLFLSSLCC